MRLQTPNTYMIETFNIINAENRNSIIKTRKCVRKSISEFECKRKSSYNGYDKPI